MLLNNIFRNAPEIEIEQISCDSRMPMKNAIFFCTKGVRYNGHDYIKEAVNNGAKVIVYDEDVDTSLPAVFVRVPDTLDALNSVAAAFYGHPASGMENIIVGGNDHRSLIAYMIYRCIAHFRPSGYIGRLGIHYRDNELLSSVPTLTILDNQRTLQTMKNEGVLSCAYEQSYSSIELKKLAAIRTDAFVYTGTAVDEREFTEYESDYISSYRNYIAALPAGIDLVANSDDPYFARLTAGSRNRVITFGLSEGADYSASDIHIGKDGTSFTLHCAQDTYLVETKLTGRSSVVPTLAVIAILAERGYPLDEVIAFLAEEEAPSGTGQRLQLGQPFQLVIEKAATVSALKDILEYAKETTDARHRIVVLFGISASSDQRYREEAARLLKQSADMLILTENDSYDRDPIDLSNAFLRDMGDIRSVIVEDREDAIEAAIDLMNRDDTLLILGKGSDKFLYRSLGRDFYGGDSECARRHIEERLEDYEETGEIY
ncbi:MAG: hypothetical protein IKE21_09510 [Erysipelotrichaceae bacterium]|nr:hypothetical protein [Erysipelotrichaceae bacterium]